MFLLSIKAGLRAKEIACLEYGDGCRRSDHGGDRVAE